MKKKIESDSVIDDLVSGLEKKFGAGSVFTTKSGAIEHVEVISTGSYSLDTAIGVGGLPKGRVIEIFGPESGGKTTIALSVVAQAQKAGGLCAYIDVENALDLGYAAQLGVNVDKLLVSQPNSAEDALNITKELIESGKISLLVVDSVAALVPKTEDEGNIGDQTMGLMARMMSQSMRKLVPVISKTNTVVVFINQIRMKIGGMSWGNPETTPGGKALGFASSVRLDIRRIATIKDGETAVGIQIKAKVAKNKVAPPFRVADIYVIFGEGIDNALGIFTEAVAKKVIDQKGKTYYFGEEKLGVGKKEAVAQLKLKPELIKSIIGNIEKLKNIGIPVEEEQINEE